MADNARLAYYRLYEPCTASEFVSFWQRFYESKIPDEVYHANLNLGGDLTESNIEVLWQWKNVRYGTPLIPATKLILAEINAFRKLASVAESDERGFWQRAATVSAKGIVWQVFIFHMARPQDYPILDQHVMRAYIGITRGYVQRYPREITIPCRSYRRFHRVYSGYRSFFLRVVRESTSEELKEVDRALWAFGRQLKKLQKKDSPLLS